MKKPLPKNWVEVSLKEVTNNKKGKKPNIQSEVEFDGSVPYMDIKALEYNKIRQFADIESSKLFEKGDVAMVWDGARSGWVSKTNFGAIGSTLVAFKPIKINSNYLFYYLLEKYPFINSNARGVGIPHVDPTILWSLDFPLPPLVEQNRIVEKLNTLFTQLETIKASMVNIPLLLKDFRQQVLTQAVIGKLTEKWRKGKEFEHMFDFISKLSKQRNKEFEKQIIIAKKEKLKKPKKDFDFDFKKHPSKENWCIAKLDNLVYMSARIGWKGLKAEEYTESGPLFISVHSLNYGENVNYEKAYHISEERYLESPEIMLEENDILLCKDGAGIGKLGIVKNLNNKATVNSSLLVIRGKEVFNSKFLFYFFSGPALQNIAKERITGTAIPHLFQRDIKDFHVEIPPLAEQQEIVSRVESLFSKADAIEQQYKSLKEKIETLPQALLHKAFKGELTEQLDSDGDARDLLKEIQSLKTQSIKVTKK